MNKYTCFGISAILFLLLHSSPLFSQSMDDEPDTASSHIRKIIVLEDTVKYKYLIVSEFDFIRYRIIDSDGLHKGKINRIDLDTLFVKDGIIPIKMIDRIELGHSGKPGFRVSQSRIHTLPDSAYQSEDLKHQYKSTILKGIHLRRALARTDTIHSNFIKLNLARLFGLEIALSYERKITDKVSLEIELGYGFPLQVHTPPGNGNPFEANPYLPSGGYSIYFGPKFYNLSLNMPGFYFEPFFMFKDLKAEDIYFPSNSEQYKFGDKYTMVYGLSLRIGTVRKYGGLVVDYYAGLGVKFKDYTYYYYGYYNAYGHHIYYNPDHSPVIENELSILPSVSLGIKLGFGF